MVHVTWTMSYEQYQYDNHSHICLVKYAQSYIIDYLIHLCKRNRILMQEPIRLGNGCLKFLVFIVSVIYLKSNWSDIYGNSNNDNEIHLVVGRDLYILLASSIGNDFRKKTPCHLQHCWWHFEYTGDPTGKSVTNISSLSLTYMYFVPKIIANINEVHGIGTIHYRKFSKLTYQWDFSQDLQEARRDFMNCGQLCILLKCWNINNSLFKIYIIQFFLFEQATSGNDVFAVHGRQCLPAKPDCDF